MTETLINSELDRVTAVLQNGLTEHGLREARALRERFENSFAVLGFVANVEEQVGVPNNAESAYLACIRLQPESALPYLHLGYFYATSSEKTKRTKELSLSCFSFVLDKSPEWFFHFKTFNFSDLMKRKLTLAAKALIQHYSSLHKEAIGEGKSVSRVLEAIWPQTHLRTFEYKEAQQKPHLFYMPSLQAKPIWEPEAFDWMAHLKSHSTDIQAEFYAIQSQLASKTRPYLDSHFAANLNLKDLAGKQTWTALDIYKDGVLSPDAPISFPKTLSVLQSLPLCGKGNVPDEVFFSILQPGQKIPPHYGLSNHSLTVHLGIKVPTACTLDVSGIQYHWEEGEVVVFDDSYIHQAENLSNETRVVLLFSIWHPSLSAMEIEAIKRTFAVRHNWLEARDLPSTKEA